MYAAMPEGALVQACRRGEEGAFAEVYRRHFAEVRRYVYPVLRDPRLAEDAAQEAFARAFRAIGRFQQQASLRTWLFRIGHNEAINIARRRPRREVLAYAPRDVPADGAEELAVGEQRQVIRQALRALPPEYREVLVLRYWQDLTDVQIAGAIGCPVGTVKSRLSRARRQLRAIMAA